VAQIDIRPLTAETWADFEKLMGPKGGYGGCWCMLWRKAKADHDRDSGEANKADIKELAESALPPGLLARSDGEPAGWISVAPRGAFVRLESSRILQPVDDEPVWSVSCFLIAKAYRRKGIAEALLNTAGEFVTERGGDILEGYPVAPTKTPYPAAYAWTGFVEVFRRAGFTEVARRSATRPIMRKILR
jgi:GNAT superfamily N-acetyltransferase